MTPEELRDIEYAARTYNPQQVESEAEKCKAGGCLSYIHCFLGCHRGDGSTPMPVCARSILLKMEQK